VSSNSVESDCVPIPQMSNTTSDLRRTDRIPVLRQVQFRTSDQAEFAALCTDVNLGGIGIDCEHVLRVGQRLELLINTKDGRASAVPMMVIYRMGKHYGVSALASLDEVLELLPLQS
jgi:PilZ domain